MAKWITEDGLHMQVGGHLWKWWQRNKGNIIGNPAPINGPKKPKHHPVSFEQGIVAYCHASLAYAGKLVYTETAARSELFHRKPGDFNGAHADCSQFGASILHWLGVKKVTDTDYTGSLLGKATIVQTPAVGRGVIWGPGTGAHFAFLTERVGGVWYTVGFGHQGAPDRVSLPDMDAYFVSVGQPGVRYLDFSR